MSEKPIVQYRAMGSRRCRFRVIEAFRIPARVINSAPGSHPRYTHLKNYEYKQIQWGLSRAKAFATANALNALNNLPLHEDTQK